MLLNDFKQILENKVQKINYEIGINLKKDLDENNPKYLRKLLLNYYNFKSKTLSKQKYSIECSKEIKITLRNIDEKYQKYFHTIKNKIQNGESITPYQSKYVAEFIDNQFYQYGINHLHLNEGNDKSNPHFIKRSKYLLLYRVKGTTVFFIDIIEHIKNEQWVSKEYWDIFNKNWPQHNQYLKLRGVTDVFPKYSLEDTQRLLNANITLFNYDENGVYMPFENITGNGAPLYYNMQVNNILYELTELQKLVNDKTWINKQNFKIKEDLKFKLICNKNELWLFEEKNNCCFELQSKNIFL